MSSSLRHSTQEFQSHLAAQDPMSCLSGVSMLRSKPRGKDTHRAVRKQDAPQAGLSQLKSQPATCRRGHLELPLALRKWAGSCPCPGFIENMNEVIHVKHQEQCPAFRKHSVNISCLLLLLLLIVFCSGRGEGQKLLERLVRSLRCSVGKATPPEEIRLLLGRGGRILHDQK